MLRAARRAGGSEVRLIPGRRTVVITATGEGEIPGPVHTPISIAELVAPHLTQPVRQALTAGSADWWLTVESIGQIFAEAKQEAAGATFAFTFGPSSAPASAVVDIPDPSVAERAGAGPAGVEPPPTAPAGPQKTVVAPRIQAGNGPEIEGLFRMLVELKASDLHLTVGAQPNVRHDGEMRALDGHAVLTPEETKRLLWPIAPRAQPRGVRAPPRHRLRLRDPGRGALPLQLLPGPQGHGRRVPR